MNLDRSSDMATKANRFVLWYQKLRITLCIWGAILRHQPSADIFYRGGKMELMPSTISWLNKKGFDVVFHRVLGKFCWTISWNR